MQNFQTFLTSCILCRINTLNGENFSQASFWKCDLSSDSFVFYSKDKIILVKFLHYNWDAGTFTIIVSDCELYKSRGGIYFSTLISIKLCVFQYIPFTFFFFLTFFGTFYFLFLSKYLPYMWSWILRPKNVWAKS